MIIKVINDNWNIRQNKKYLLETGLEPARCYPTAPQAVVSTNSTTRALILMKQLYTK